MRQIHNDLSSQPLGKAAALLKQSFQQLIAALGEPVVITRRAETGGGAATTLTFTCLPEPLRVDRQRAGALNEEALLNVGEDNPHDFVFDGDADVQETTDTITWNGQKWRVLNVNPQRVNGLTVLLHVYGARQGM
jgi:hypothetical protein